MPSYPKGKKAKRVKPSGKSPTHLDLIRQLPCLLTGGPAEAAHIRFADAARGKPESGMGRKPDDKWTVPLCPALHRLAKESQHNNNERKWWEQFGVDPLQVASELYGKPRIVMERIIIHRSPWAEEVKERIRKILREDYFERGAASHGRARRGEARQDKARQSHD